MEKHYLRGMISYLLSHQTWVPPIYHSSAQHISLSHEFWFSSRLENDSFHSEKRTIERNNRLTDWNDFMQNRKNRKRARITNDIFSELAAPNMHLYLSLVLNLQGRGQLGLSTSLLLCHLWWNRKSFLKAKDSRLPFPWVSLPQQRTITIRRRVVFFCDVLCTEWSELQTHLKRSSPESHFRLLIQ